MNVRTTRLTDEEVATRADELEAERPGYGAKFLAEYRAVAENIERFPQMYPTAVDGVPGLDVRNALLDRFKLRVVYLVREADVVIVTVIDARQRPRSWHHRLTELD